MWNFDSSKEQRQHLINLGIESVQNYFSFNIFTIKGNIKRRFSVG
jgi:hypothetical protein